MKKYFFTTLLISLLFLAREGFSKNTNLLCLENGARVVSISSSDWGDFGTYFDNEDDFESGLYCSAEGAPFPHFIIYELANSAEITSFEFDTEVEEIAFPGVSAKDVRIYVQQTRQTDFTFISEIVLNQDESGQIVEIEPVVARRLKIEILSNYGQELFTEIARIKAFGNFNELSGRDAITGVWQTTFGELRIGRAHPFVSGCYDGGALHGTFDNRVISFYWTEKEQRGIVSAVLNEEGNELLGFWGGDEHDFEIWSGTLLTHRIVDCQDDPLSLQLKSVGETILFNFHPKGTSQDSSGFAPTAILTGAVRFLIDNPDKALAIESFNDSDSNSSSSKALAELWALRVKNYLVQNGISDNRLTIKGISESRPIADNETVTGKPLNQRIRLRVTQ